MSNFEKLIGIIFPFAEGLLQKFEEFYPIAMAIKVDDEIVSVGVVSENGRPNSSDVLAALKKEIEVKQEQYKAFLICYNARMEHPDTSELTDVFVYIAEDKENEQYYHFYYPYQKKEKTILFDTPWKSIKAREVL